MLVVTNMILPRQKFCRDEQVFVATKTILAQVPPMIDSLSIIVTGWRGRCWLWAGMYAMVKHDERYRMKWLVTGGDGVVVVVVG